MRSSPKGGRGGQQMRLLGKMLPHRSTLKEIDDGNTRVTLITHIARGGFADVWTCKVHPSDELRAAKVVLTKDIRSAPDRELVENEITLWSTMDHKNIVKLRFHFRTEDRIVCVTDLMTESLLDLHVRMRRLGSKPRFVTTVRQLVDISGALSYVHARNIIHRDLKSANVLLRDECCLLSDFGLARIQRSDGKMTAETGSYRWMAPEVIRHEPYDESCDIYSFAMLIYEMITLSVPFGRFTPVEAAFGVANDAKRPHLPPIGDELRTLIVECWDQDKVRRPCADDVHRRLQVMSEKKASFGSLEMSEFTVERRHGNERASVI